MADARGDFRFGLSGSAFGDINEIIDSAVAGEKAGFDSFVIPDLAVGALSPLITLAAVARATKTISLGTFVLNTGLWNPKTVARDLATLDRVSGGRIEINLGTGIPMPPTQGIIPPDRASRFTRLQDTVKEIKAAFDEPGIAPGFVNRPRIRIAGGSDRVLRLVADEADGFILASVPPVPKVKLPQGHMILPEGPASEAFLSRLPGHVERGVGVPVHITDDAQAEAVRLAEIHTYLTPGQILASPKILIGTVDDIAAQILARRETFGFTYYVLRGAEPAVLGEIIRTVKGSSG